MMIQIILSAPANFNGPLFTNHPVPFVGRCNVKLLQVDVHQNAGYGFHTIRSNTLLKPPYISRIFVDNCNNFNYLNVDGRYQISEYMGNNFIIEDVLINGYIDITINRNLNDNLVGGNCHAIVWLDIEYTRPSLAYKSF